MRRCLFITNALQDNHQRNYHHQHQNYTRREGEPKKEDFNSDDTNERKLKYKWSFALDRNVHDTNVNGASGIHVVPTA